MMELYEERRPQYSAIQLDGETLGAVLSLLKQHGFTEITAHFPSQAKSYLKAKDRGGNDVTIQWDSYLFYLRTPTPPFRSSDLIISDEATFHALYKKAVLERNAS